MLVKVAGKLSGSRKVSRRKSGIFGEVAERGESRLRTEPKHTGELLCDIYFKPDFSFFFLNYQAGRWTTQSLGGEK